ncbi:phage tail tube protein [Sinirhodobacter huangdaonensis]|uniref:Lambda phage tail tube protein N-terminal domain-containing protein n=1 Tax=Paenirhodobacter huangdaonensis TaxID=2501515 RepID=A0A3S3MTC4_9RHOB|nr:phage tail tube protein [Sinirhodobacter huangdaonensis]RWR54886.1 hypothetical protein EOW66_02130 [Sinirhodobacter huangdaonensis]
MSTTGVAIAWGAKIRIGRGAVPAWTVIKGVGDFDMPTGEADDVDATSHSSPNRTKEYISGMIDNGTMSVPVDWIPESEQDILLRVLRRTGEVIQLEITPAGAETPEVYAAFVKSYGRSAPVQGKATGTVVFRVNGIVTGDAADPAA